MVLFFNVNALFNVEPRATSTGINTCHICVQLIVLICQLHVCMTVSIHAKQH